MAVKEIITPVGIVSGRDAIYLDKFYQSFYPSSLHFEGEFNSDLCSLSTLEDDWIKYKIDFISVIAYEVQELDHCYWENEISSSFDESDVCFFDKSKYEDEYRYFYFSTYDYMFKIVAKDYKIEIVDKK